MQIGSLKVIFINQEFIILRDRNWRIRGNKIDKKNNQKLWERWKTDDKHNRYQRVK